MGWIPAVTGGAAAAAAAAEEQRKEEEEMTGYTREELEGEWEFKIVRSFMNAFANPRIMQRLVEEEARAGWEMVEKFDNGRVRFKRHKSARGLDDQLRAEGVDPYRANFGAGTKMAFKLVMVGAAVLGMLVVMAVSGSALPVIGVVLVFMLIVAVAVVFARGRLR